MKQAAELRELVNSRDVPADIAMRARIVLWSGEGRRRKDCRAARGVAADRGPLEGSSCRARAGRSGRRPARRGQGAGSGAEIRARVIALTRMTPPAVTGLSHWSTRELATYLKRTENVTVSWHYVARIWREENLKHRNGTLKISKDPAFADKVADAVGLCLAPGGVVVLSIDEKTQVQALDRTQPVLPVTFAATETRTHDYVRHGTTNLFAALNVGTGEVVGECKPIRNGKNFLVFPKKAVKPHAGKEIHVVLDNLSTHVHFPLHPRRVFLDQPNRDLVRNPDPPVDPPRHVLRRERPDQADPRLRRLMELRGQTIHLDRNCRRDLDEGPTRPDQRQETRRKQLKVMQTDSRETRSDVMHCVRCVMRSRTISRRRSAPTGPPSPYGAAERFRRFCSSPPTERCGCSAAAADHARSR